MKSFTGTDARYFELPAGEYIIRFSAEKGAEGTIEINEKQCSKTVSGRKS